MAVRPFIRGRRLIKRYSTPLYHRKAVVSSDSVFDNEANSYEIVTQEAKNCTLQTTSKNDFITDVSGLATTDYITIYTQTPLFEPVKGGGFLGSGIYIPDSFFGIGNPFGVPENTGGYFNAVEVHTYQNQAVPHFMALLVKDTSPDLEKYPEQRVQETASLMDTLPKYQNGDWVQLWADAR
ncbi:hypothetical protein NVP1084O_158 [Vibrio phage 1.084.O._10N.261.49.F5]|nr:hypothetical protein NVP1084O_158 [Vibrio phage 1.084.O._10N.261.49.F5]